MDSPRGLLRHSVGVGGSKEIETAPKTVGETLSAIAQSLKHEGEEKRKQLRMDEGKQAPKPTPSAKELPKETKKNPSNQK